VEPPSCAIPAATGANFLFSASSRNYHLTMSDPTIELLKDLVAIDSVNPSLVPGGAGEREIGERVAAELRRYGMEVVVSEAAPGRTNVVGVLEGSGSGPTLMLCGHSDTVGVEGMAAPFDPVERDGKLFGRGTQDMKGGVASILGAARKLAEGSLIRKGRVVVAIVADEEYASIGAEAIVRDWKADAAIVTEPTDLVIGIGHKGFEWVEIDTHGVAAHGSRPDDGVDAIVLMGRVLDRLGALDRGFIARPHPLLGRPSVHASLISGGRELSTYPDHCRLSIERRIVDGEAPRISLAEMETILRELHEADPRFHAEARFLFSRPAYLTPEGHALPRLIAEALGERKATIGAMSFWTDAAILGGAGIASVVFGPGGAGLHGIEEYVRIDEVLACRDAIVQTAARYCG
jgi:acetylornithine deacetylase